MRVDVAVQPCLGRTGRLAFSRTQTVHDPVGVCALGGVGFRLALARGAYVDDAQWTYRGAIISSGRTTSSNSASVTKPSFTASSRRVVPFLWAVLATVVALS